MITSSLIITTWFLSASGLEGAVGGAVDQAQPAFAACFELQAAGDVHAVLRFQVGADLRATAVRVDEESAAIDPKLCRCLEAAIGAVTFPERARGADVAYPVRHFRTDGREPAAEPAAPDADRRPWALGRSGNLLGDPWVVTRAGRAVSDLELARVAGGAALSIPLVAQRKSFAGLAAAEGGLALAGLGLVAYGGRDLARGRSPTRLEGHDVGMAGAGLLTAGVAGVLCLYHLLRTTDLGADRPVWHYLTRDQAAALVASENDPR